MLKWDRLSPGEKRAAVALAAMLPGYVNAVFVAEHLPEAIAWQRGELTDDQLMERTGWVLNATPEEYAEMAITAARRAGVSPVEWLDAMKGAYPEQRAIAAELQQEGMRQSARRPDDFWQIINANTWPDLPIPDDSGPDDPSREPGRPET
ncbi:hypothetical protein [Sphaerisporangium sp. TRM90804]|uniref:hypothetical protein n=1 Tax=Sphaerisporangium sp. TRM90804 TaxID=3031113 RepID=UPI0024492090|nr:hypothetical protein [Sphaerisporangium sp. TRM90804]MDH2429741.1 hypothetical protein [Sphaerisporangium sp. TRM90804]